MASPNGPPVLSTPATHIFEAQTDLQAIKSSLRLSDEQLYITYEIDRTTSEIRKARYARVALQFPDHMLPDAPRVFEALSKGLNPTATTPIARQVQIQTRNNELVSLDSLNLSPRDLPTVRLYILADTSYGACCVDEIAAEHINADAVIHYGRACLSPTARMPVTHVFTVRPLPESDHLRLTEDFENFYGDPHQKIILMADVTYQAHLSSLMTVLQTRGFDNLFLAAIVHDPSSPLPNRTVPDEVKFSPSRLQDWHLFHISDPPESLLLTLASGVASIRIYPTAETEINNPRDPFIASTSRALNRRYALLTSVSTVSIFGILINTLSVKNYLYIVEHVKSQLLAAGKKSYTFVVGKVNAAKVANFSEIGAWIVIGCWESSLIDSKDFWKPVLTPFELELALKGDEERVWTGEWSSDFQKLLNEPILSKAKTTIPEENGTFNGTVAVGEDYDSEPESAPPDFNLRTGRYVSSSRPMRSPTSTGGEASISGTQPGNSLIKRAKGDLAVIGGEVSPGAEHLRSKRTWKGLGSDFEIAYEETGAAVEEGRSGIARGYTHDAGAEART